MSVRVVWGICLVVAAMTTSVGFELFGEGGSRGLSYALVVGGVLLPVLASRVIQHMLVPVGREV